MILYNPQERVCVDFVDFTERYFKSQGMDLSFQQKELAKFINTHNQVVINKYRFSGTTTILCLAIAWEILYGYISDRTINVGIITHYKADFSLELRKVLESIPEKVILKFDEYNSSNCDFSINPLNGLVDKVHVYFLTKLHDGIGIKFDDIVVDEFDLQEKILCEYHEPSGYQIINYALCSIQDVTRSHIYISYSDNKYRKVINHYLENEDCEIILKPYLDERYKPEKLTWVKNDCRHYAGEYNYTPMEAINLLEKGYKPKYID
jgi:hypothetical protein